MPDQPQTDQREEEGGVSADFLPSPLVGEGGAKRRMRGLYQRAVCSLSQPLTRLECAPRIRSTLSHRGRGEGGHAASFPTLRNSFAAGSSTNSEPSATPK